MLSVMPSQVSIIIPTYNHRDFVVETLESVFAQTFTDYEIIVVNDGSPDDTATVLQPYISNARMRYIEQPNAGQAAARNRGVAEAEGEFIAFLDDDDIWPANKLQWQVAAMSDRRYAAIGGLAGFIEDGRRIVPTESDGMVEYTAAALFRGSPFWSPGQVLIRRSVFAAVGGLDEGIWGSDDLDLYIRVAAVGSVARMNRCACTTADMRPMRQTRRSECSGTACVSSPRTCRRFRRNRARMPPDRVTAGCMSTPDVRR